MIRFLYSTDWHYTGKNMPSRKDNYPETIEAKIRDFFWTGHKYNVAAFLGGGDFFNSHYTSSEVVSRLGQIIREETKGKMFYGVWGNHDIRDWNPKSVTRSSIGVMQEFNDCFQILDREPTVFEANGMKVNLTGVSAHAQLDKHILDDEGNIIKHRARDWIVEETNHHPHIHIVHGYLSPVPVLETIRHTVIDEMKHTKATITLGAHEHLGFPVTKTEHGFVYNPGSLGRIKASIEEMNRIPNYALITIHDDGSGEIQPIQCSIAEPGRDVMDRSYIDAKKEKEAKIKAAKENIRGVLKEMNIKGVDLNVIMEGYRDKTKPEVYQETLNWLGLNE